MKILALEFSSPQRSAAVVMAGSDYKVLALVTVNHGKTTGMAMVEETLRQAGLGPKQIDKIAVGLGPGSYAGVRSAIAIAQGWQLARGVPACGVSSMAALAEEARAAGFRGEADFIVDAQRSEVYRARYLIQEDSARELQPLAIVPAGSLVSDGRVYGPEATRFVPGADVLFPSALSLARLAAGAEPVAAEFLEPIYLREASFVKAPPARVY